MARAERPSLVVIAGPNGAGKSTLAPLLLRDTLAVTEFVNADVIARGLSAFAPEQVAMAAGRLMLERLRDLAGQQVSFAFETTLASRSFAPWIRQLLQIGYRFHLVFLSLPSAAVAVQRVASRVRMGGHAVPADASGIAIMRGCTTSSGSTCPWPRAGAYTTLPAGTQSSCLSPRAMNRRQSSMTRPCGNVLVGRQTMARSTSDRIGRAFADGRPIDKALRRAAAAAILQHKRAGIPLVIWREGKIVRVSAEELVKSRKLKKRSAKAPNTTRQR